jgi:peptide/nickel transport system permease protein
MPFVAAIVIWTAVKLPPGDFSQSILGQRATKDAVEAICKDLGLDQSLLSVTLISFPV